MNDPIRGCPQCMTKVKAGQLGLRDYRWLKDAIPGRAAPMDIDAALERNGDFLAMEFKPENVVPSRGALITFEALRKKGFQVWTIQGDKPYIEDSDDVKVWWNDNPEACEHMPVSRLREYVGKWYEARSVARGNRTDTNGE